MTNPFTNASVWLIGSSTGIGRSLAKKLSPHVKYLFISSRSEDQLVSLKNEINLDSVVPLPCDVSSLSSLEAAYAHIKKITPPDFLIYNAGIYNPSIIENFDLEDYLRHIDINLSGALRSISLVLPDFLVRNQGNIAVVSSVAGYRALPNAAAYGASKAALTYFMESMRMSVQHKGIKISIINPGFVKTRLTEKNSFDMPFIITPEVAADEIYKGILSGKSEIHFPKRFSFILKLLGFLPEPLYRYLMVRFIAERS
jgi:short-subunit dehydrogenase